LRKGSFYIIPLVRQSALWPLSIPAAEAGRIFGI